jgi:hypothetical protein
MYIYIRSEYTYNIYIYIYIQHIYDQGDEGVDDSNAVEKTGQDIKGPVGFDFLAVRVDTALALVPV